MRFARLPDPKSVMLFFCLLCVFTICISSLLVWISIKNMFKPSCDEPCTKSKAFVASQFNHYKLHPFSKPYWFNLQIMDMCLYKSLMTTRQWLTMVFTETFPELTCSIMAFSIDTFTSSPWKYEMKTTVYKDINHTYQGTKDTWSNIGDNTHPHTTGCWPFSIRIYTKCKRPSFIIST